MYVNVNVDVNVNVNDNERECVNDNVNDNVNVNESVYVNERVCVNVNNGCCSLTLLKRNKLKKNNSQLKSETRNSKRANVLWSKSGALNLKSSA